MAREQRKDVDYFPHECTHGRKMHIIETKYGNDGYATWFKLLEQLGKANNHYIDISDEMTLMFLTSTFKIDEEKTIAILTDLSKLGGIDKFLFDEYKIIWSEKFCNSIEDAYRKRKQKLFLKEDILALKKSIPSGNPSIPSGLTKKIEESNQKAVNVAEVIPKEEYSIVEEIKEEEIKEENTTPNGVVDFSNQPNQPKIDFKKLVSFFNSNRGLLPEVKKLSDARKTRILNLEKQYGKECIQVVIEKTRDSKFLQGENKENWMASFDWIFKPANFLKILEDNYINKTHGNWNNNNQKSDSDLKAGINDAVDKLLG
jgi:Domain of unknown function (DUF4373)